MKISSLQGLSVEKVQAWMAVAGWEVVVSVHLANEKIVEV